MKNLRRLVVALLLSFTLTLVYHHVAAATGMPIPFALGHFSVLSFFAFSLGHSLLFLGGRRTLVFVGGTFLVSLILESAGVLTGLIYGRYYYTDRMGYKILGLVPLLIPLSWFMMIYASYDIADLIIGPRRRPSTLADIAWQGALASLAMTAWDLSMDPRASSLMGMWVWLEKGPWFGVPVQNYVGWLITAFAVYLLYGLYARRFWPDRPAWSDIFAHLPALSYTLMAISEVLAGLEMAQPVLAIAAFLGMGGLSIIAWARFYGGLRRSAQGEADNGGYMLSP